MRVAPVGLFAWQLRNEQSPQEVFNLGTELAALTHGHPTGQLIGGVHGAKAIPEEWLEPLELRDAITELAVDLYGFREWEIGEYSENEVLNQRIWKKYPGF
jgi:ADP-ribosylglycohydrolase